jgi:hypothetical protein
MCDGRAASGVPAGRKKQANWRLTFPTLKLFSGNLKEVLSCARYLMSITVCGLISQDEKGKASTARLKKPSPSGRGLGEGLMTETLSPFSSSSLTLRALSLAPLPAGEGKLRTGEKPPAIAHGRLSGELLGLTCVLAVTFGKKVSQ